VISVVVSTLFRGSLSVKGVSDGDDNCDDDNCDDDNCDDDCDDDDCDDDDCDDCAGVDRYESIVRGVESPAATPLLT
jgi:hypothetical protein